MGLFYTVWGKKQNIIKCYVFKQSALICCDFLLFFLFDVIVLLVFLKGVQKMKAKGLSKGLIVNTREKNHSVLTCITNRCVVLENTIYYKHLYPYQPPEINFDSVETEKVFWPTRWSQGYVPRGVIHGYKINIDTTCTGEIYRASMKVGTEGKALVQTLRERGLYWDLLQLLHELVESLNNNKFLRFNMNGPDKVNYAPVLYNESLMMVRFFFHNNKWHDFSCYRYGGCDCEIKKGSNIYFRNNPVGKNT